MVVPTFEILKRQSEETGEVYRDIGTSILGLIEQVEAKKYMRVAQKFEPGMYSGFSRSFADPNYPGLEADIYLGTSTGMSPEPEELVVHETFYRENTTVISKSYFIHPDGTIMLHDEISESKAWLNSTNPTEVVHLRNILKDVKLKIEGKKFVRKANK